MMRILTNWQSTHGKPDARHLHAARTKRLNGFMPVTVSSLNTLRWGLNYEFWQQKPNDDDTGANPQRGKAAAVSILGAGSGSEPAISQQYADAVRRK